MEEDPIVICGMAVRLPGGIKDTQDFWDLMISKKSGLAPIPDSRWNLDGFYSPVPRWGTIRNRECYMLDDRDLAQFDASYFTCGEKEIEKMDPMQRQLLEIVHECLDNAGESGTRGQNVGCYVGNFSSDWQDDLSMDPHASGLYRGSGYLDFLQPNRVSYEYGWTGPSMLVKTGCSSSMVALHLAAEAVRNGACHSAMALGCNLITSVITSIVFTETGVLSPSGKCKTFDLLADGYGRGEAVNAVFVKRLSDALSAGNPVRAILRATGTNNDGRSNGIMNPNTYQQEALIRQTYEKAGIHDFSKTAFFECHGTGTPTGDPLEVAAVARIWKDNGGVLIGAVKPNVGHSEGAAGLTSIIKAVLALEHKIIPPNIYLENPNPRIPWEEAQLSVPTEPTSWPPGRAERISVNSFGVAGSNAHVILESYEGWQQQKHDHPLSPVASEHSFVEVHTPGPHLLLFSASHMESLKTMILQHQQYLGLHVSDLDHLANTLGFHRDHLSCRAYAVTNNSQITPSAPKRMFSTARRIVFTFTGQGVHWAGMGKVLLKNNKTFGETIRRLDRWLRDLPEAYRPDWTLRAELLKEGDLSRVGLRGFSHPCTTAVQVALVDVLSSLGVTPEAITGHSGGEAAAAYAAGSISAEAAMAVAYFRGWILLNDEVYSVPKGTMAAVSLGVREITPFLIPGVVVGCENSPVSSTLSGDPVCIQHCIDQIHRRHPDVSISLLKLETSFHSPWIEPLGEPYEKLLTMFLKDAKAPSVSYFSSVTGIEMTNKELDAAYFRKNFVQPVLFNSAMDCLLQNHANNLFIEIGPHPALQAPVGDILKNHPDAECGYVTTLKRGDDQSLFLLRLTGELFLQGVNVDLDMMIPRGRVLTDLPTYPWLHDKRYIDEPRNAARYKARQYPRHDLLGARVVEGNDIEPAWRNMLDLKEASWLLDHIVNGQVVFPGTGYAGIVGEAIRQISEGRGAYTIRDMIITTPLTLPKEKKIEIYTRLIPEEERKYSDHQWYHFKIMTCDGQHWLSHCTGLIRSGADVQQGSHFNIPLPDQAFRKFPRQLRTDEWYSSVKRLGIEWQNAFQGLEDITAGTVTQEASATVYDFDDTTHYEAHPTLLDQMLQTNLIAMTFGLKRRLTNIVLPTKIGYLAVHGNQELRMRIYGAIKDDPSGQNLTARSAIYTEEGRLTAYIDQIQFGILPTGKCEDLPLGSYFRWDKDITFLDSLENLQYKTTMPQSASLQAPGYENQFIRDQQRHQFCEVVRLLGFKFPNARIVEIGDGITEMAQAALYTLQPSKNDRFFSRYTYASISDDAVDEVSKALSNIKGEVDKQGVMVGGIEQVSLSDGADIIVLSAQTLGTDDDFVQDELESIKNVLSIDGRLVIYDMDPTKCIMKSEDLESIGAMDRQLKQLGLCISSHPNNGIVTAKLRVNDQAQKQSVSILAGKSANSRAFAQSVKAYFESNGTSVIVSQDRKVPTGGDLVISLLDLDGATVSGVVHSLDASTFRPFVDSLCNFAGSLIWLLPVVHEKCNNPFAAMVQGLARTIRIEHKTDITIVEVDNETTARGDFAKRIWAISQSLIRRRVGGTFDPDFDYAIRNGVIQIPRMRWFSLQDPNIVRQNTIPTSPTTRLFRQEVSYLLVGGFGGLGHSIATWMAEHGARNLVFLSRTASNADNDAFITELKGYPGCTVTTVSGDVSKYEDVSKAIESAPAPIAGVMQLSLVLRDNSTKDMTFDEWTAVVQPRVNGTWNVHEALVAARANLDFFMIFGSGGGHTGYYGQANYSASNTFLDAFVQYRHQLGLPASIIDLGVVGDVGYLLEQQNLYESFRNGGFFFLTEQQVLDAAAISLANNAPLAAGPLSSFCLGGLSEKSMTDPGNRVNWKRDVRFALSHNLHNSSVRDLPTGAADAGEHADEIARLLELAKSNPSELQDPLSIASLAKLIAQALSELMLRPKEDFPTTASLSSIGLDSIVSIELVDWIQQKFHIAVSSMEITSSKSLTHLAEKIVHGLVS